MTPDGVVRALRIGALAYVATWLASLVCLALALVLALVEDVSDDLSWWWLLTGPGQLVAMAFRSPAEISVPGSGEGMAATSSFSATGPVLVILAVAVVTVLLLSRRDETASPNRSTTGAVTLAVTAAATFVLIALAVALVVPVTLAEDGDSAEVGAAGFELVAFGLIGVSIAALVGRRRWTTWSMAASVPLAVRAAWRGLLAHLAVFSVLTVIATIVWVIVQGGASTLLVLPVVLGNLLVYAVTLGHLGALSYGNAGSFVGQSSGTSDTVWLFSSGADKVLWLLLLFAVVGTLASAVVLRRADAGPRTSSHWVWTAVVYAVAGGVLMFLGLASSDFGSGYGTGTASFGPEPWFFAVFAAWGLLAELGARSVGPALAGLVPAAWLDRAVRGVDQVPVAGVTPTPAPVAATSAVGAAPSPTSAPMDARSKRILAVVGGLVVAGVLAVVGVSVAGSMFFGPDKPVEKYFAALGDGRASDALELVRLDSPADERLLLTDEVLGDSDARIEDVRIGDVQRSGSVATVTVEYTIDGAQQSQDVTLTKSGSRFVVFDDWKIVDPDLGAIEVRAPGAAGVEVNGRAIDVDGLDDRVRLSAFPGTYEITPGSGSKYLSFESEKVSVGTDEESADFEVTPTDELLAEVASQADQFVAACIARTEADPAGCPNRTYGYRLQDVRWTLDAKPTYDLRSDYDGGWRFSTKTPGRASVTAKQKSYIDDEKPRDFTDQDTIDLSGDVTIDGDTVTVDIKNFF
ncbi:hypothetical protein [Aeromicrobium endophyticum]|uniref:hypothetical protein n=1 Tax=Aeromicrobium endophyticum TaxID=2292704 RepID=UPI0018F7376F|nr:hypothetical protein [Aeromicrobium endophyticum]